MFQGKCECFEETCFQLKSYNNSHLALLLLACTVFPCSEPNTPGWVHWWCNVSVSLPLSFLSLRPSRWTSSTQMKLEGKIRRLLGDEFQEKVSLSFFSFFFTQHWHLHPLTFPSAFVAPIFKHFYNLAKKEKSVMLLLLLYGSSS